jgi:2-polyprenyl-3-methyl-5-hydroxy-6-metoxy-1,4-benzoquinol methylase
LTVGDKAGKAYWDKGWENTSLPAAIDPRAPGWNNSAVRRFHRYFKRAFSYVEDRGDKLLEIGAARSEWLPYFAKEFGFKVSGLDYSEIGCVQAAQVLENEGVKGEVVCADLFSPPPHMKGIFDVVFSAGVAEHFEDTAHCLRAMSEFLKPGGLMVTEIPHFTGIYGSIQRLVNRPVLDLHVLLDRDALAEAHERAGLQVLFCDYFLFAGFHILGIENLKDVSVPLYNAARLLRRLVSMGVYAVEEKLTLPLRPNRVTSPYIMCTARKLG